MSQLTSVLPSRLANPNSPQSQSSSSSADADPTRGGSHKGPTKRSKGQAKDTPGRQRRAHHKSRLGCANCKLRSVKCDEGKPSCNRCVDSGFTCTYTKSSQKLQLSLPGEMTFNLTPQPAGLQPQIYLPVASPVGARDGSYEMTPSNYTALQRFRDRTVWSLGTRETRRLFTHGANELAKVQPFVMHVFLALSLIHDSQLNPGAFGSKERSSLAFHWYHGTSLFKEALAKPASSFTSTQKDALWAASAVLGAASFAHVETDDPYKSWPLAPESPLDLDWLRMSDGKKAVWAIVDPTKRDSAFKATAEQMKRFPPPGQNEPIRPGGLPPAFYRLFDIPPDSCQENNKYHTALSILSHMLPEVMHESKFMRYLVFMTMIEPSFKQHLQNKDGKSMLILVYWFAKVMVHITWWTRRRSLVEGQAICIYLERHHGDNPDMMELLEYPKEMFRRVKEGEARGDRRKFLMHSNSPNQFDDSVIGALEERIGPYKNNFFGIELQGLHKYTSWAIIMDPFERLQQVQG